MLNTAQIQEHFGIKLTAEFIETDLKIAADKAEKRARYWEPSALPKIGEALAKHAVLRGAAPVAAAASSDDNSDLF